MIKTRANQYAPKLNAAQCAQIIRRYQAGERVADLAREYGVTVGAIYHRLRQRGIMCNQASEKNYKLTPRQRDEIAAAYASGTSSGLLAKQYGVQQNNVLKIVKSRGVPAHPRGPRPGTRREDQAET